MIKLVAIAHKMLLQQRGGRGGGLREMAEELSKTCGRFRRGSTVALPAVGGRAERRGKEPERPGYSEEETRSRSSCTTLS